MGTKTVYVEDNSKIDALKKQLEEAKKNFKKATNDNEKKKLQKMIVDLTRRLDEALRNASETNSKMLKEISSFREDIAKKERDNEKLIIQIENMKKEIEQEKRRKQKEEEENRKKNEKAIKEVSKGLEEKIENELKNIEKDFKNLELNWCRNDPEIRKTLEPAIDQEINEFLDNLKVNFNIQGELLKLINLLKDNEVREESYTKFNIIILGSTGTGKSTFINQVLGSHKALESGGKVGTVKTDKYSSEKYPFISLYDTRGIEYDKNYDLDYVKRIVKEEIDSKLVKGLNDESIHCLLYFLHGARFQQGEGELLKYLRSSYDGKKLPIIIVYTKALFQKDITDVKNEVDATFKDEKIGEDVFNIEFIDIISRECEAELLGEQVVFPIKNLSNLFKRVGVKSQFAVAEAAKASLKNQIKQTILKQITNNMEKLSDENYLRKKLEKDTESFFDNALMFCFTKIISPEEKKEEKIEEKKEEKTEEKTEEKKEEKKTEEIKEGKKENENNLNQEVINNSSSNKINIKDKQLNAEEIEKQNNLNNSISKFYMAIIPLIKKIAESCFETFILNESQKSAKNLLSAQIELMRKNKTTMSSNNFKDEYIFKTEIQYKLKEKLEDKAMKLANINLEIQALKNIISKIGVMLKKELTGLLLSEEFKNYIKQQVGTIAGEKIKMKVDEILIKDLIELERKSAESIQKKKSEIKTESQQADEDFDNIDI